MAIIPDFLVAVLAAWLGANVVARTSGERATRVFGLLTLLAAVWSSARALALLTASAEVRAAAGAVETAAAALLPAALLHLVLAYTEEYPWSRPNRLLLGAAYAAGAVGIVLSPVVASRSARPGGARPLLSSAATDPLVWTRVSVGALIILLAAWLSWRAWRAGRDTARGGQLGVMFAAVVCSALGGILTVLLTRLSGPEWLGTGLVFVGLLLTAYAVLVQGLFLAPGAARRSFLYSVVTGLVAAGYVALLLGAERLARAALGIEPPLVTGLALVLTIAWFDPVRLRFRRWMDRWLGSGDITYSQLLRAMGDEMVTSQRPRAAIRTALTQMCRTLGIRSAAVEASDGVRLAVYGGFEDGQAPQLAVPLLAAGEERGTLLLGPKRSRLPYTAVEREILGHAGAYVAASLRLAERQTQQVDALQTLSAERAALRAREAALAEALARAEPARIGDGLSVWALGPLRVERDGAVIRRWGGAKAGTRQAEAMFAFLFDRGARGVAKDELIEVIWPDVPLDRADLAFHRTLGGLRRILEPEIRHGSEATAITYHNDRYRLDPGIVGYSDAREFQDRIAAAGRTPDAAEAIALLEEARALYRGEYLDDCPFYGDSLYVEDTRSLLRGRYIDLLLALGERYEQRGDAPSAAAAYRDALRATADDCPRADDGLARLGLPL